MMLFLSPAVFVACCICRVIVDVDDVIYNVVGGNMVMDAVDDDAGLFFLTFAWFQTEQLQHQYLIYTYD